MQWGQFKGVLADAVVAHLEPIQQRYHEVMADAAYLDQVSNARTLPVHAVLEHLIPL